jgi:hypothetical protein
VNDKGLRARQFGRTGGHGNLTVDRSRGHRRRNVCRSLERERRSLNPAEFHDRGFAETLAQNADLRTYFARSADQSHEWRELEIDTIEDALILATP